ncbi:unnamed protein product [Rotaria sordida]|uniref:Uncharacterized protein n=1 Tax=Rotaria sordida TaxID=392033 RepID=A0A819AZL0_9BILA|nr:unnamed protein product [Rotaria sordida]
MLTDLENLATDLKKEIDIDIDIDIGTQTPMDYDDGNAYNLSSPQHDEDQQQNLLNTYIDITNLITIATHISTNDFDNELKGIRLIHYDTVSDE